MAKEPTGKPPQPPKAGAEAMAEQALSTAQSAVSKLQQSVSPPKAGAATAAPAQAFAPPVFDREASDEPARGIDLLGDVNLNVKIELGRTRMLVEDVLKLSEGAVVELDKLAGDPVDVYVNERHVAKGEVLVLNDNFCVRVNEILADPNEGEGAKR